MQRVARDPFYTFASLDTYVQIWADHKEDVEKEKETNRKRRRKKKGRNCARTKPFPRLFRLRKVLVLCTIQLLCLVLALLNTSVSA